MSTTMRALAMSDGAIGPGYLPREREGAQHPALDLERHMEASMEVGGKDGMREGAREVKARIDLRIVGDDVIDLAGQQIADGADADAGAIGSRGVPLGMKAGFPGRHHHPIRTEQRDVQMIVRQQVGDLVRYRADDGAKVELPGRGVEDREDLRHVDRTFGSRHSNPSPVQCNRTRPVPDATLASSAPVEKRPDRQLLTTRSNVTRRNSHCGNPQDDYVDCSFSRLPHRETFDSRPETSGGGRSSGHAGWRGRVFRAG